MDRCALFVDAGYVLADGAMAVHGTRYRESVSWDYAGLLQFLGSLAQDRAGLPLLRCYWYEATVEGRRTPEHDALADLPGLKLRLGKMRPGRREGVESEIHRDVTTLARNGAISDALVVSAEEDLAHVIADVQDLGVRVTIVHVTVDGNWTISRSLRQECDDIIEIGGAHLRPYVDLIAGAEPARFDEQYAGSQYPGRALSNGHSAVGGASLHQALPAGSHAGPPAIYTAPVVAEYQRPAQHVTLQRPDTGDAPPPRETGTGRNDLNRNDLARSDLGVNDLGVSDLNRAEPDRPELGRPDASRGVPAAQAPVDGQDMQAVRQDLYAAPVSGPFRNASLPPAQPSAPGPAGGFGGSSPQGGAAGGFGGPSPQAGAAAGFGPSGSGVSLGGTVSPQAGTAGGSGQFAGGGHVSSPNQFAGGSQGPAGPGLAGGSGGVGPTSQQVAQGLGQPGPGQGAAMPQGGGVIGGGVVPGGTASSQGVPLGGSPPQAGATQQAQPVQFRGPPAGPPGGHSGPSHGPAPGTQGLNQGMAGTRQGHGGPEPGPPTYAPPPQHGPFSGPQPAAPAAHQQQPVAASLGDAVQAAHAEGQDFGDAVARDAPALWLEAVLARKPRMPSDLEARLLQGSALPIDFLLHDEVRHALRRGFWDALERSRR